MNMSFIKRRFPDHREVTLVFSAVVFAVFTWAVRSFIYKFPAFILYYGVLDLFSILAYLLTFALLESLLVTALIVGLAALLPGSWLKQGFAYKGFLTVLVAAVATIYIKETMTNQPTVKFLATAFGTAFAIWIGLLLLAHFWLPLQRIVLDLADRISIFLYIYLPLGLVSVSVVLIRLIW